MNILFAVFVFILSFFSQKEKLVSWNVTSKKINENQSEILFKADIKKGYIIYDSQLELKDGPIPTSLILDSNENIIIESPLIAISPKEKFDKIWESKITYFEESGTFSQKISFRKVSQSISGIIKAQACSEKDGRCMMVEEKFEVDL